MKKQHEFTAEEVAKCQAEFPGLNENEARISLERRQVYGDPYQNHAGIAAAWAGILQVWAPRIARGDALPPHVIALLMAQLKMNRCRLQHHQDNYDDANVYMTFASAFQQRWEREGGEKATPDPMAYFIGVDLAKPGSDKTVVAHVNAKDGKVEKIVPLDSPSSGEMRIPSKGDAVDQPEVRLEWEMAQLISAQFHNSNKFRFTANAGTSFEIEATYDIHPGQCLAILDKPRTYDQVAKEKKAACPHTTLANMPGGWQCGDCGKMVDPRKGAGSGATSIHQEPRNPPSA